MRRAKVINGSGIVETSIELKNETDSPLRLNLIMPDKLTFAVTSDPFQHLRPKREQKCLAIETLELQIKKRPNSRGARKLLEKYQKGK